MMIVLITMYTSFQKLTGTQDWVVSGSRGNRFFHDTARARPYTEVMFIVILGNYQLQAEGRAAENEVSDALSEHNQTSISEALRVRRGNLLYIFPDEGAQVASTVGRTE